MKLAPADSGIPNFPPIPVKEPFDPATPGAVAFGRATSPFGSPAIDLVFAPFADGFRRFEGFQEARAAAASIVATPDRATAVAIQHGADGAAYLGQVLAAGTLKPVHFATAGYRFEQPLVGAGELHDYVYMTGYGNYLREH